MLRGIISVTVYKNWWSKSNTAREYIIAKELFSLSVSLLLLRYGM